MNIKLLVFGALFIVTLTVGVSPAFAVEAAPEGVIPTSFAKAIGFGLAAIAAGYAIGRAGSAGLAAAAERPELKTYAIIISALGEALAIYGLVLIFVL